jgi:hypothetical protein
MVFVVVLGEDPSVNVPEPVAFAKVWLPEAELATPSVGVAVQVDAVVLVVFGTPPFTALVAFVPPIAIVAAVESPAAVPVILEAVVATVLVVLGIVTVTAPDEAGHVTVVRFVDAPNTSWLLVACTFIDVPRYSVRGLVAAVAPISNVLSVNRRPPVSVPPPMGKYAPVAVNAAVPSA